MQDSEKEKLKQQTELGKKIFAESMKEFLQAMLDEFPGEDVADNVARREKLDDCADAYALAHRADEGLTDLAVSLTELQTLTLGSDDRKRLDDTFAKKVPPEGMGVLPEGEGKAYLNFSGVQYAVWLNRINGEFETPLKRFSETIDILDPDNTLPSPNTFQDALAGSNITFNATQKMALTAFMGAFRLNTSAKFNPARHPGGTSRYELLSAPFSKMPELDITTLQMIAKDSPILATNITFARVLQKITAQKKQVFIGETCVLTKEFRQVLQNELNQLNNPNAVQAAEEKELLPANAPQATVNMTQAEQEAFVSAEQQEAEIVVRRSAQRLTLTANQLIFYPENADQVQRVTAQNMPPADALPDTSIPSLVIAMGPVRSAAKAALRQEQKALEDIAENIRNAEKELEKVAQSELLQNKSTALEQKKEQAELAVNIAADASKKLNTLLEKQMENRDAPDEKAQGDHPAKIAQTWAQTRELAGIAQTRSAELAALTADMQQRILSLQTLEKLRAEVQAFEEAKNENDDIERLNALVNLKSLRLEADLKSGTSEKFNSADASAQRLLESLPIQKQLIVELEKLKAELTSNYPAERERMTCIKAQIAMWVENGPAEKNCAEIVRISTATVMFLNILRTEALRSEVFGDMGDQVGPQIVQLQQTLLNAPFEEVEKKLAKAQLLLRLLPLQEKLTHALRTLPEEKNETAATKSLHNQITQQTAVLADALKNNLPESEAAKISTSMGNLLELLSMRKMFLELSERVSAQEKASDANIAAPLSTAKKQLDIAAMNLEANAMAGFQDALRGATAAIEETENSLKMTLEREAALRAKNPPNKKSTPGSSGFFGRKKKNAKEREMLNLAGTSVPTPAPTPVPALAADDGSEKPTPQKERRFLGIGKQKNTSSKTAGGLFDRHKGNAKEKADAAREMSHLAGEAIAPPKAGEKIPGQEEGRGNPGVVVDGGGKGPAQ